MADDGFTITPISRADDGFTMTPITPRMSPSMPIAPDVQLPAEISPMVNQSVLSKKDAAAGKLPTQLDADLAAGWELYDKSHRVREARLKAVKYSETPAGSGIVPFALNAFRSGRKELTDAALAAPSMMANFVPPGLDLPLAALKRVTGNPQLPAPTTDDVAAGLKSITSPMTFKQARENIDINEGAREYTRPVSSALGKAGGDLATVVGARLPFARAIVEASRSPEAAAAARDAIEKLPPNGWQHIQRVWASPRMSAARRMLGKAGETGIESAVLSALHSGNPLLVGSLSAGGQIMGSAALAAGIKHPYLSLLGVAGTTMAWQSMKNYIPDFISGPDSLIKSGEHAVKVQAFMSLAGGLASMFGAGRFRGSEGIIPHGPGDPPALYGHGFARSVPKVAEGINAALRGGSMGLIRQVVEDQKSTSPVMGTVLDQLSTNVNAFHTPELRKIEKATQNGTLRTTIQEMLGSKVDSGDGTFAQRMGMEDLKSKVGRYAGNLATGMGF